MAYKSYREWVKHDGFVEPGLPGLSYTAQQMFWISTANIWCSKKRPEGVKSAIATDPHSPSEFRILGPLSNMIKFANDFDCPVGSPMNPQKKNIVW